MEQQRSKQSAYPNDFAIVKSFARRAAGTGYFAANIGGFCVTASNWQLPGSNNGTSWTPVDTQTFSARQQRRVFTVASPASYSAYRLHITQNNGADELQLAELQLY